MPKKQMYFFASADLLADFALEKVQSIGVSDANGIFLDFSDTIYSSVDVTLPDEIVPGTYIRHRINDLATLVVRVDGTDHGYATYVIEVDLPEGGLHDRELYLCPVCGSSGPHRILFEYEYAHSLTSDGKVSRDLGSEPTVCNNSETICQGCGYKGEKRDFDVKSWKEAEEGMIPQA